MSEHPRSVDTGRPPTVPEVVDLIVKAELNRREFGTSSVHFKEARRQMLVNNFLKLSPPGRAIADFRALSEIAKIRK